MNQFTAGEFEVSVSGPYPCWIRIMYRGELIAHGIHHEQLKDLQFALDRAGQRARRLLGKDAAEME